MSATLPDPAPGVGHGIFVDRIARSSWRLLALAGVTVALPLATLYLLRGTRGVVLGASGLAGAAIALTCFARPFETLALSLFIFFSGLDVVLPGPVAFGLLVLVGARTLFDVLGGRPLDWGARTFRAALLVLFAIALTSLLVARSFAAALEPMRYCLWGGLFFATISFQADSTRKVRALLTTASLAFACSLLITFYRVLSIGGLFLLQPTGHRRLGVGDPNFTAVFACVFLAPLVHVLGRLRLRWRVLLAPLPLLYVAAVVMSVSRMGMALMALTLAVLVLRARRARPYAVLGVVVLAAVLTSLPSKYWIRFTDLGQLGGILIDRSLQLRQHALESGWHMFRAHPWLGVGLGNFPVESPRWMSLAMWSHNTYIDVAATLGIFGFIAFMVWQLSALAMVGRAYRLWGIGSRPHERALAFAIGASLGLVYIGELTLNFAFHPLVWIFMAMANAVRRLAEAGAD